MKFKNLLRLVPVLGALALSGCEVPVMIAADANDAQMTGITQITFPAKMLITSEMFDDRRYAGTMIGHMSGAADFDLASAEGERCVGRMEPGKTMRMVCGARTFEVAAPKDAKKTFSGAQYAAGVADGAAYEAAFGWGKGADDAVLRRSLAAKRSLTAKEVRALNPG